MAVTKLNVGSRAPAVVVVGLLLATCLVLTATTAVASASRTLKVSASSASSSSEGDGSVESLAAAAGYTIQTVAVVGGTGELEDDGGASAAAPMLMDVDMLGGIKNQGPSPGDGH